MKIPNNFPIQHLQDHTWDYSKVDSTKLQTYLSCPRQYFYNYVLGWRPDNMSNHLVFGQAWHSALEHLYSLKDKPILDINEVPNAFDRFLETYRAEWPESTDGWFGGKTPEAALRALVKYCQENAGDNYKYQVLATEVTDTLPITEDYQLIVKLDTVIRNQQSGLIEILEHKTGSYAGQWWARQWHLSIQVGAYISACDFYYQQKDTNCIVDGTFFLKTGQKFQRELVSMNSERLNDWLFTVVSAFKDMEQDFESLSIDASDLSENLLCFRKNPVSCEKYGGCPYYDLCTCLANPLRYADRGQIPEGFKEYWWRPISPEEEGNG